ncbi:Ada metal-binding domain-containing protein [Brevundimonas sp.]|uniref:Ada metal-binding domain-containing protein n=1 Tax=Brevundimonas sp. TaxID=1871086 RepID=UPI003F724644
MDITADNINAPASLSRHRRLAQIYRRDPRAEGRFWYSVVTTGVYCRPTCPSRHARPENIRLHDTLEEARATGFRPCLRCRPEAPALRDRHRELVEAACRHIETRGAAPSPRELADAVGVSQSHLYRLFRRLTGMTPSAYARSLVEVAPPPRTTRVGPT